MLWNVWIWIYTHIYKCVYICELYVLFNVYISLSVYGCFRSWSAIHKRVCYCESIIIIFVLFCLVFGVIYSSRLMSVSWLCRQCNENVDISWNNYQRRCFSSLANCTNAFRCNGMHALFVNTIHHIYECIDWFNKTFIYKLCRRTDTIYIHIYQANPLKINQMLVMFISTPKYNGISYGSVRLVYAFLHFIFLHFTILHFECARS